MTDLIIILSSISRCDVKEDIFPTVKFSDVKDQEENLRILHLSFSKNTRKLVVLY